MIAESAVQTVGGAGSPSRLFVCSESSEAIVSRISVRRRNDEGMPGPSSE